MMTEEKAEQYIHDTLKQMDKWGKRPTIILVHPDYHLLVSRPAAKAGLNVVVDSMAPLDKFMFQ